MRAISMVGHADDLGELLRAWIRVAGSAGRTVPDAGASQTAVITGAAGIGKTRLVSAVIDALDPRPAVVLAGTARVHSPAPYDWLAAVLGRCATADLPVPADALAWLRQDPDMPRERYAPDALLRIAVRVVRALAGAGPAVLVVEDLHALDLASLNLVAELAVTVDLPALLLVTSRPANDAGSPELVTRTLARLTGAPGAIRQHLIPLRRTDVADVLAQVYPDADLAAAIIDTVWERTGGVPYRLTELLATSGHHGPAMLADPTTGGDSADDVTGGGRPPPGRREDATAVLTAREREVLAFVAAGLPDKSIARQLGISVRTVGVHVSNLLRKTGSASRTDAALWAVRHRIVAADRSTGVPVE